MAETPETADGAPREGDRIAKLLARAGIASRREVERLIAEGRVKLNGEVVTTPATLLTSLRGVTVNEEPVRAPEAARLFAFHKPVGLLTAERDPAGRPTIYTALRNALPPGAPRVMPVGRLDLNTEGLLLLTNDGELKRAMELPSSGIPRTYRARTFGDVHQLRLEDLMDGIEIEGVRYGPINANLERSAGRNKWIELTLTEGKNREVRRVLEYLGLQVSRLLRVSYGPFLLADLPRGAAVEISPGDVEKFRLSLRLAPQEARAVRQASARPAPPAQEPEGRRRRAAPVDRDEKRAKALARRAPRKLEEEGTLLTRSELGRRGRGAARAEAKAAPHGAPAAPSGSDRRRPGTTGPASRGPAGGRGKPSGGRPASPGRGKR